jgi:hypothetical protein
MEATTLRNEIKDALRRIVPDLNVVMTSGEDDFNENMARLGGWDAWEHDVATGIRYDDRQPRFHAIILSDSEFGKATASIARQALTANKLVMFYDSRTTELGRVAEIITLDEHNWKTGWCAHLL